MEKLWYCLPESAGRLLLCFYSFAKQQKGDTKKTLARFNPGAVAKQARIMSVSWEIGEHRWTLKQFL